MIALLSPAVPDSNWTRLCNMIVKTIPLESIGIFQTLESFYNRIRQGRTDITAAVVFASDRQDIIKLQGIRELISDMRMIMILPDAEEESVKMGHSFYPRYISFTDSTFEDVAAVLQKIISNTRKDRTPPNDRHIKKNKLEMTLNTEDPTPQI
jgi:hypothetical protein